MWLRGLRTWHSIQKDAGSIPDLIHLFSGLRIPHCHKLWHRSQMQLGSAVAVAVAHYPPAMLTPIPQNCVQLGVLLWLSGLGIQHCHCSGLLAVVWVPFPAWELSYAMGTAKNRKKMCSPELHKTS